MPQKRVLNSQALLELISFAAFAATLLFLLFSGQYRDYVTPKMIPYFLLAVVVMLLWVGSTLTRLFRPLHRARAAHCLVLVLPVLLLLLPHSAIGAGDVSNGLVVGGVPFAPQKDGAVAQSSAATDAATAQEPQWTAIPKTSPKPAPTPNGDLIYKEYVPAGLDREKNTIVVDNDHFSMWLSELPTNLDQYVEYEIEMTGFVFRDKSTMKNNEFVPARLMMSCCAADLAPCGFLCTYDNASQLKENAWVTVRGTVYKGSYEGHDMPEITVKSITPAQKVEGYILP